MTLNEYQISAKTTAVYSQPIIYPTLGLTGEAGEVAEKVKKMIRDDNGILTLERRELLIKELGDVSRHLAMIAHDIGVTLDKVAEANIEKLESRLKKGMITGDGDMREVQDETNIKTNISNISNHSINR